MPSPRNRYEMLRPIASGGMATVYLGVARGAGGFERPVAIKVMHPGLAGDPRLIAMFFDEARVAANIRHMNVVATLDVAAGDDGALCLVMEYVEGHSLRKIARVLGADRARMPIAVALRIVLDVLAGLHAAHELTGRDGRPLALVHRDISPHNILVSNDGVAKLTDFGIARSEQRLGWTRDGEIKGKLAYMALEQMRDLQVDRRTDIYAIGVVLWELLTGERLFTGAHEGALALAVCNGATKAPHEAEPAVPGPLSDACMRALRADPEQRHATATAFADALEAAAAESGVAVASRRAVAVLCAQVAGRRPCQRTPPHGAEAALPAPIEVWSLGNTHTRRVTELGLAAHVGGVDEHGDDTPAMNRFTVPPTASKASGTTTPGAPPGSSAGPMAVLPPNLRITDTEQPVAIDCEARLTGRCAALALPLWHRIMPVAGAVGAVFAMLLWLVSHGDAGAGRAHRAGGGVRIAAVAAARGPSAAVGAAVEKAPPASSPESAPPAAASEGVAPAASAASKKTTTGAGRARPHLHKPPGVRARPGVRRRAPRTTAPSAAPSSYRPRDL